MVVGPRWLQGLIFHIQSLWVWKTSNLCLTLLKLKHIWPNSEEYTKPLLVVSDRE